MSEEIQHYLRSRRLSSSQVLEVLRKDIVRVYLAGPISSVEALQGYRATIKKELSAISSKFVFYDPWEKESLLEHALNNSHTSHAEMRQIAEKIVTRDLKAIAESDLLIAYIFRISAGTSMEIFWASRILKRPVIVIFEPEEETGSKVPLWIYAHANLIFSSLQTLKKWLVDALEEVKDSGQ